MEVRALEIVSLIGEPAIGKDTQAALVSRQTALAPRVGLVVLGDTIRAAQADQSHQFHDIFVAGGPEDETGAPRPAATIGPVLMELALRQVGAGKDILLFPSFPATSEQLDVLFDIGAKLTHDTPNVPHYTFIRFFADQTVCLERIAARRLQDESQGRKPKPYDNPETARARIRLYSMTIGPMMSKVAKQAAQGAEYQLITVDANRPIGAVQMDVRKIIESMVLP